MEATMMPKETKTTPAFPRSLVELDAHLLKDVWGITPDQLSVVRHLPSHRKPLAVLARMGRDGRERDGKPA
jgi:hypothetical protein